MTTVSDVKEFVSACCDISLLDESALDQVLVGPAGLGSAGSGSVTLARLRERSSRTPITTNATVLIADSAVPLDETELRSAGVALIVRAPNARLEFARLVEALFPLTKCSGVDETATVHPGAQLGRDVSVGAGASIGMATIGDGCQIDAGAHVLDGVTIGQRCHVFANAVIGADGFGFERDEHGIPVKFPQRGRVIIGDDVEIGAGACVDCGALSDTVIEDAVKIDNLVHIAHNVRVGSCSMIAAHAVIAGSTVLGRQVWVGPSATISNGLTVGDGAQISLGAVVTRDVPAGMRVSGNFAVEHDRFLRFLRSMR